MIFFVTLFGESLYSNSVDDGARAFQCNRLIVPLDFHTSSPRQIRLSYEFGTPSPRAYRIPRFSRPWGTIFLGFEYLPGGEWYPRILVPGDYIPKNIVLEGGRYCIPQYDFLAHRYRSTVIFIRFSNDKLELFGIMNKKKIIYKSRFSRKSRTI